ncbi:MAG TPA: hypothetical protein PLL64_07700 [Rhodothermales bacterium]|nr:hypothetical protein [Bacteroidota bacterium]HRK74143.1 hypothetical protein [Rhodothermales bacterium]HRR09088.1 hypothetical protein [Rhodothermales bacterium]
MYTRDTVLRLVEQYARVIAQALGLARENKQTEAEQALDEALQELTGLPPNALLTHDRTYLADWLKEERGWVTDHFETLGDVFVARAEVAETGNQFKLALMCYQTASDMYQTAQRVNPKIFSLPLQRKIQFVSECIAAFSIQDHNQP